MKNRNEMTSQSPTARQSWNYNQGLALFLNLWAGGLNNE